MRAVARSRPASAVTSAREPRQRLSLAERDLLVGGQDAGFGVLQGRRDVALAVGDRLLARVLGRHQPQVGRVTSM